MLQLTGMQPLVMSSEAHQRAERWHGSTWPSHFQARQRPPWMSGHRCLLCRCRLRIWKDGAPHTAEKLEQKQRTKCGASERVVSPSSSRRAGALAKQRRRGFRTFYKGATENGGAVARSSADLSDGYTAPRRAQRVVCRAQRRVITTLVFFMRKHAPPRADEEECPRGAPQLRWPPCERTRVGRPREPPSNIS